VHTVSVPPANTSVISQLPALLREDDAAVLGDKGYVNNAFKQAARQGGGVFWGVSLKARPTQKLSTAQAYVEHVFRVISGSLAIRKCATGAWRRVRRWSLRW